MRSEFADEILMLVGAREKANSQANGCGTQHRGVDRAG